MRNSLEKQPEHLRHCTVFIEAPGGLPADVSTWNEPWYNSERPQMLTVLLRKRDLPRLWLQGESLEEGIRFTAEMAARRWPLLSNRDRVGDEFVRRGNRLVSRWLDPKPPVVEEAVAAADLSTRGGIRNDAAGVARARKAAEENTKRGPTPIQSIRVSDRSTVADLVRMIQGAGGRVVFFEMPLHSYFAAPFANPIRERDRLSFIDTAHSWDCGTMANGFSTKDDDFPDIWHMRKSLSAEFSRALARSYAERSK